VRPRREKLTERLELRLSPEQKAAFREWAEDDGMELGAWLRALAERRGADLENRVRTGHDSSAELTPDGAG
jgi:hypothetical protein